jgi:hypothetical protein
MEISILIETETAPVCVMLTGADAEKYERGEYVDLSTYIQRSLDQIRKLRAIRNAGNSVAFPDMG